MKNIIHLGRVETRDGSTIDYLFDNSTGKFYAKIFTFAIGSNNSNRTTELKVNTIEDLKSKLKNKNIKWTRDAITTFPQLKENMKKQINVKLTPGQKKLVKEYAKKLIKEEVGLPTEVFTVVKDIGIKPSDVTSYRIIDKKHVIEFKIHNLTLDLSTIKHHKITDLVVTNGEAELQFRV